MELVLGTVQFGLEYGIAGSGSRVNEESTRAILELAWASGIRTLDTAPAYGDIEGRLDALCLGRDFRIVSKISSPSQGRELNQQTLFESLQRSLQRLGPRLSGVLFHNANELEGAAGMALWTRARDWALQHGVKVGSSGYAPNELHSLHTALDLDFVQLPGNALDQRVQEHTVGTPEVHLRSCFLQGLLLMPLGQAESKLPAASPALRRWHTWLEEQNLSALQGALSVVKGFRQVTHCVVGVDSPQQLADILEAWECCSPLPAHTLQTTDLDIIDPRRWRLA